MKGKKKFVHIDNTADRAEYHQLIKKIDSERVCPMCTTYFLKNHPKPILRNAKHWIVTTNISPYVGTTHHFIFVHKKHIEQVSQLTPAASAELIKHVSWLTKKYNIKGGGFFMRYGDGQYTSASVAHLHAQLFTGVKKSSNTFPIFSVLGFGKKK